MPQHERIDAEGLLSKVNIVDVVGRYVSLTKKGGEWVGQCPFHNDDHASLSVNERKQIFKCFPCDAGGDAIAFLMKMGRTFHESCEELNGGKFDSVNPEQRQAQRAKVPQWKQIISGVPLNGMLQKHYRHGSPSRMWNYDNADGSLRGYVCRFDTPEGKEVLPLVWATDGNRSEWRWLGFDEPRPLYQLDEITNRPDATIVVVEGEKTADALQALLPHIVATCWIGGANGLKKTDFSPLHGRKVVLWPDNDFTHKYGDKHPTRPGQLKPFHEQPGNAAMYAIADMLKGKASVIKWVRNPEGTPCGWDVADSTWSSEETRAYVKANLIDPPPIVETTNPTPPPPPAERPPIEPPPYEPPPFEPPMDNGGHYDDLNEEYSSYFKMLGFDKNESGTQSFYFYSKVSKVVIRLSASNLTPSNLMTLAPIQFWEKEFPSNKGALNTTAATNFLIQLSNRMGAFSPKLVRGRGAWMDESRVVVHSGDELYCNGRRFDLGDFDTKYIYERSETLSIDTDNPLNTKEANRLMEVMNLVNWDREISAYLMAGWCVIAPVCGALKWRPHIWLTGSAGTGKSWVFKNIVRALLGETCLTVQSETTEAGLRQALQHDALPVVFDEAEGEDKKAQDRMQSVLALMRASSSEDGGLIMKGTAGHSARTFQIRSCFAFASIAVQVAQQSDRTRVTILGLKKSSGLESHDRWMELQRKYDEIFVEGFAQRLIARTLTILPVILKNARTFSNAVAAEIGEQRAGDQIGYMLAGAYSLYSDREISFDKAVEWIKAKDWSEEKGLDKSRDEFALISHFLDQMTTVETSVGKFDRTLGELVQYSSGILHDEIITWDRASQRLGRLGFKATSSDLIISNSSDYVKKCLQNTPWSKNHNKILMRIEGAKAVDSTRFASGVQTRAVSIPLTVVFGK
jgi:putative DNA primase/helicase